MPELTQRRRNLVVLCSAIVIFSGTLGTLVHNHPILRIVWLVVIIAALIYAGIEFVKIKKEEG